MVIHSIVSGARTVLCDQPRTAKWWIGFMLPEEVNYWCVDHPIEGLGWRADFTRSIMLGKGTLTASCEPCFRFGL